VAIKGDYAKLGRLQGNLSRLAKVPSQVATDASKRIAALIEEEFEQGKDPYGRNWAPLKPATLRKGRRPPPLTDTHTMRDSVRVAPLPGSGIAITIDDPANIHQTGSRDMVARPILPRAGFPASWSGAIRDATQARIKEKF
jgi:hypothetical protein